MIKMVFYLGIKKEKKDNFSLQITHLNHSLPMNIIDTLENWVSNVDGKSDMIKVSKSSVKSQSKLLSCSICSMYNRSNCAKKKRLVLNSYIPEINLLISPGINYDFFFRI